MTSAFLMDHRLMAKRRKTIYELKPDLLWDAYHGVLGATGDPATHDGLVTSWVDRRHGVTVTQATADYKPRWNQYGLSDHPAIIFDGNDRLVIDSLPASISTATQHTVVAICKCLDNDEVRCVCYAEKTTDASNYFLYFGLNTSGNTYTRGRAGSTLRGAKGDSIINNTDSQVLVWTNSDATTWQHYANGTMESMTATDSGNSGYSFGDIEGLNEFTIGYAASTVKWVGWISLLAIWGKAL